MVRVGMGKMMPNMFSRSDMKMEKDFGTEIQKKGFAGMEY